MHEGVRGCPTLVRRMVRALMTPIRSGDDEARSGGPYSKRKPADLERARRYRAEREGRYRARKEPSRMRPISWVVVAFNVIMLVWMVLIGVEVRNCDPNLAATENCLVGFLMLFVGAFWFVGDVILGIVWLVGWLRTDRLEERRWNRPRIGDR